MKQCPNCKMTVDAYSECPICGADITKEPHTEDGVDWKYTDDYLDSTYALSNVLCGPVALIGAAIGLL